MSKATVCYHGREGQARTVPPKPVRRDVSDDPLSAPKLKIRWLNQRIGEIDQICDAYLTGSRYGIDVEPGPEPEDRFAKIKITEPVPDALYMLIGEVAIICDPALIR